MKKLKRAAALVCAVLAANALTAAPSAAEGKATYAKNWGLVTNTLADAVAWMTGTDYLQLRRNRVEKTDSGYATQNVTSVALYSFEKYENKIFDFADEPCDYKHSELGLLRQNGVFQYADQNVVSVYNGFNGNMWLWDSESKYKLALTNYYDTSGKKILGPYFAGTAMRDGYAVVALSDKKISEYYDYMEEPATLTFAVIDQTGKTVAKLPAYLAERSGGVGNVVSDLFAYRIGFMNCSEGLFPFWCMNVQFDGSFDKPVKAANGRERDPYVHPEHPYGFMDNSGKIVIGQQYDMVQPFSDGLAVVELGRKKGLYRQNGQDRAPAGI